MARLHTCNDAELGTALCEQLSARVPGNELPAVYRQMGNSQAALDAYLSMESGIEQGSLSELEIEAVKLLVSELNGCDYCLSVHTVKSQRVGIAREMQLKIRRDEATGDAKLDAILAIVRQFFKHPGKLPDAMLETARQAGVSDKNLLDIVLVTSTIFLTNTFNHLNDTELSFKPAPSLSDSERQTTIEN